MVARFRKDERGISAVVVGVSLVALFGALVLSLDAGQLFTARRGMVTATDTAALTGARAAVGLVTPGTVACPPAIEAQVVAMLQKQEPGSTLDACTLNASSPTRGYVTVDARRPVDLRFGAVLGLGKQSAFSSSSVRYGYLTGAEGLRPIGICLSNPHIQEWLTLQTILRDGDTSNDAAAQVVYNAIDDVPWLGAPIDNPHPTSLYASATGPVHRIFFSRPNAQSCSSDDDIQDAAGNWGWQDFNAGSNSENENEDWLMRGFGGEVSVWDPDVIPDSDPNNAACSIHDASDGCIQGTTGSRGNSISQEMEALIAGAIKFHVPIFDRAVLQGGNTIFTIRAFVGVIVRGYNVTGAEEDRYFDVEFYNAVLSGSCCADQGEPGSALTTTICAVDHDDVATATRCG